MRLISAVVVGCFLLGVAPLRADGGGDIYGFQIENDLFGAGSDRHYTHGTRLSYLSGEQGADTIARRLADTLSFSALGDTVLSGEGGLRYAIALGQNMFTPEDLGRRNLIINDRPYAGWLYGSFALVAGPERAEDHRSRPGEFDKLETLELSIGVVGPASGADRTQKFVHSVIDSPNPEGWHNQLENEPGIMLSYERKFRTRLTSPDSALAADLMPSIGATVGNIHTFAAGSVTIRAGTDLANDFGPPRIRPSVAGSEYYDPVPDKKLSAYVFASLGGRAVGRNVFLDGNSFTSSHSVDKERFVMDAQFGLVVSLWGRARLSFTNIIRTKEFETQDGLDEFGAISLSFRL